MSQNEQKRQNTTLANNNHIIVGASGSGKSAFLRKKVDFKQNRIVAWDVDEDFRLPRVRSMKVFETLVKKCGFGKIRVALTVEPTEENFERFCALVFAIAHCSAPMTIICEEIADVTRVSKASPHWGQLCRKIRKYGGTIYAVTQRPEEADKTIFNQATFKWCGALGSSAAYKKMAAEMDINVNELRNLQNFEGKQIEYWLKEGTKPAIKDKISFVRRR
jgi:hypothetical protein